MEYIYELKHCHQMNLARAIYSTSGLFWYAAYWSFHVLVRFLNRA